MTPNSDGSMTIDLKKVCRIIGSYRIQTRHPNAKNWSYVKWLAVFGGVDGAYAEAKSMATCPNKDKFGSIRIVEVDDDGKFLGVVEVIKFV